MIAEQCFIPQPAAELFPPMSKAECEQLKADIAANGLREPIVIYEGQILDGRNRYRACVESGIEPRYRTYEGSDPVDYVLSVNLHRRHLDKSQRAMSAAALATLEDGGDRSKLQICSCLTHDQAAQRFGVSERQVAKATALLKAAANGRAPAELVERVRSGKISLNKAENLLHLPKKQRRKAAVQSGRPATLRTQAHPSKQRTRRFELLASQAAQMCVQIDALATGAEESGELTPEWKERLIKARFRARRLVGAFYPMPVEEA